ncbi:hypothetical protein DWY25_09695, partial [Holdemania filiformis]
LILPKHPFSVNIFFNFFYVFFTSVFGHSSFPFIKGVSAALFFFSLAFSIFHETVLAYFLFIKFLPIRSFFCSSLNPNAMPSPRSTERKDILQPPVNRNFQDILDSLDR